MSEEKITFNVVLIGNPNSGKSSLFNALTGLNQKTGNYSGVTVDLKKGKHQYKGYEFNFVDLPGTYSVTAFSPDEVVVRRFLSEEKPDLVLNVVSASDLERNLYLSSQLIDMDIRMVMALNMYDELERSGAHLDYKALGKLIGIPFVPTVGTKGEGVNDLLDRIIKVYEGQDEVTRHIHIFYGQETELAIKNIRKVIQLFQNER